MPTRRILFVLARASCGGPSASLINLLFLLKKRNIEVDVFLMDHFGEWTDRIAKYGNLLPLNNQLNDSITDKKNLKTIGQLFNRIVFSISARILGSKNATEGLFKKCAKHLSNKYDVVVAYQESMTTDFVKYIHVKQKIGWFHTDFSAYVDIVGFDNVKEQYESFSNIICVTHAAVNGIKDNLPEKAEGVVCIRNTLPSELIMNRADEFVPREYYSLDDIRIVVSVGRLSYEKALDRVAIAAKVLKDANIRFHWFIVGAGNEEKHIKDAICACDVSDVVSLIGAKSNPYPYIKYADCLVITSSHEAQPMVANEALTLGIPVVSTKFDSVYEVVDDGINGFVVEQDAVSIGNALKQLFSNDSYYSSLKAGAELFAYPNDKVVEQFLATIDL